MIHRPSPLVVVTAPDPSRPVLVFLLALLAFAGCGGGAVSTPGPTVASEAAWRALRAPRPTPLDGAVTLTVSGIELLGAYPWPVPETVEPSLGLEELVVTGLLRRRDVDFVERRRFSQAAEAERQGLPRPRGRPPVGVSRSADLAATAIWVPTGRGAASVEVRLSRLETGEVAGATRLAVATNATPVTLARTIVDGIVTVLGELDRASPWADPLGDAANAEAGRSVSTEAVENFLNGLAAEERWDWEGARRGYEAAAADPTFHEARAALARAARLRLGGTLAES